MAAAKAEVKKEEDLSLPEYFMRGAKKGFYITVELIAPAMVMAYTLITWGRGQKVGPIDRGVRRSIYVFA